MADRLACQRRTFTKVGGRGQPAKRWGLVGAEVETATSDISNHKKRHTLLGLQRPLMVSIRRCETQALESGPKDESRNPQVSVSFCWSTELPGSRRITLGADKGYDTREFVASCRALKVTRTSRAMRVAPAAPRSTAAPRIMRATR